MKKRNWAFVIYPESLPKDWKEQLYLSGLSIALSPLHDKDLDPTEEVKKPHYHVIVMYGNPTTYNNVKNFTDSLNGTIPIPLEQVKGYYRYLTHKDNPEKYQYNENEIELFNGFEMLDVIDLSATQILSYKMELVEFIIDNDIYEYFDLIVFIKDLPQHFKQVATTNTYFFNTFITSRRNKLKIETTNNFL